MAKVEPKNTPEITPTPTPTPTMPEAVKKKTKKLAKDLTTKPGTVIITVIGGEKGAMEFPFSELPKDIQTKFGPFGYGHKLGDAAAGKSGIDAENAILKVADGLKKGDWSVRAPAVPKISIAALTENFTKLSTEEKETAKVLLAGLGITIPGIS